METNSPESVKFKLINDGFVIQGIEGFVTLTKTATQNINQTCTEFFLFFFFVRTSIVNSSRGETVYNRES